MSNPHQMMLQYLKNKQSQFDPTVSPAPVTPPTIMQEGKVKDAIKAAAATAALGLGTMGLLKDTGTKPVPTPTTGRSVLAASDKPTTGKPTNGKPAAGPSAVVQENKLARAALAAGIAGSAFGIGAGIGAGGHGPNIPNPPMRHVDRGVHAGAEGQGSLLGIKEPASAPAQAAPAASASKPTAAGAAAAGGALGLGAGAGLGALAGYSAGRRRRSVTESLTSTYLQMIRDRNLQEGGIGSAIGSIAGGALGMLAGPLAPIVSPALSAIGGAAGDAIGDASSTGKVGEDDATDETDETPKPSKGGRRRRIAGAVLGGLLGAGIGSQIPLPGDSKPATPPAHTTPSHGSPKLPLSLGGGFDMRRDPFEGGVRVDPRMLEEPPPAKPNVHEGIQRWRRRTEGAIKAADRAEENAGMFDPNKPPVDPASGDKHPDPAVRAAFAANDAAFAAARRERLEQTRPERTRRMP